MSTLDIIDEHLAIRETVGYEVLSEVPIEDMPKVLEFLKIVYNYNRMKRHEEAKTEDEEYEMYRKAYEEKLRVEKREERRIEKELIKKILDDPRNADGFSDDEHRYPRYQYEGYTYVLNDELTQIMGVEVPTVQVERHWLMEDLKEKDWIESYKKDYDKLLKSGMFYEIYPEWTGNWKQDKYAFAHEQRFKKK